MVKIRLQRFGSAKRPFYRIVAADALAKRDGRFLEIVGTYDPRADQVKLNNESIEKWLNVGAQPTDTVRSILKKAGVFKELTSKKAE